jgi:uncharacterized membrane protein
MARKRGSFRATLVAGLLFLLPLILGLWLLSKALPIAERLSGPIVRATGVNSIGGVAFGTIVGIAVLFLVTLLAGWISRTRMGQATYSRLENGMLSLFPQWRMARGLIESFGSDEYAHMDVVLVPTDAGWCLGFVLEPPTGEWWTVFIPGAPQWTSGQVAYAHADQVHRTELTFAQAIVLLRKCGVGSTGVAALLASLREQGQL